MFVVKGGNITTPYYMLRYVSQTFLPDIYHTIFSQFMSTEHCLWSLDLNEVFLIRKSITPILLYLQLHFLNTLRTTYKTNLKSKKYKF